MMVWRRLPSFAKELFVSAVISAVLYKLSLMPEVNNPVQGILVGRRKEIYAAVLGLHGTLLGFIIAAITIALTFVNSPRFEILRRTKQWPRLFGSYTRSMRWAAMATLLSFIALLVDNDARPNQLAATLCFSAVFFATLALTRMLWVTEKTVKVAISAKPRLPGE
ncbi:hypothetical protein ABT340_22630 [Streptosporangium sp. NPDC000239]|uniref:hypothetical protein n=1 Tax=Streptosporangium sp. NPDC000239 TaxID=3154248 RepID=UPI0033168903